MGERIEWSAAEAAVGEDDPDSDWKLRPLEHAGSLPVEAGPLQRILSGKGDIPRLMARYVERDSEAGHQQRRYRRARRRLVGLAYAAAVTGLLALGLHMVVRHVSDAQTVLVAIHAMLVLALAGLAAWLTSVDPRSKWLAARGDAEQLRVALFERVLASHDEQASGELPLLPLQLAYFRRYQLDVQLRYFQGRGKQLTRLAGVSRWYTAPCIAIVLIALGLAVLILAQLGFEYGLDVPNGLILAADFEQVEAFARWGFLALGFSSIYAIVLTQQSVTEDQRNGTRYLAVHQNLAFLKEGAYERVRKAAEAGNKAMVDKFVGLVHGLMLAEQSEWISYDKLVTEQDKLTAANGLVELFADRFEPAPRTSDR